MFKRFENYPPQVNDFHFTTSMLAEIHSMRPHTSSANLNRLSVIGRDAGRFVVVHLEEPTRDNVAAVCAQLTTGWPKDERHQVSHGMLDAFKQENNVEIDKDGQEHTYGRILVFDWEGILV